VPNTKTVLALLATSWAIVQVATVFVFSFLALLITRILLGAGEGPSHGTSVSAATPWLPADRRAFGLAIVTFGSAIGPALFAPPLTFLIVVVGWRSAFALLGGIGFLWVIIWLLVGREYPETKRMLVYETQDKHPRSRWADIRPVLFSRTVLFSILAAFVSYWAIALYLSWNPVYLVTVRHLTLSDPLYLAGITLPYVVGGIALIASGAFADRVFRRTRSHRRSYVYPVTALLIVSALCLYLAVSVPSALGSVIFFTLALIGVINTLYERCLIYQYACQDRHWILIQHHIVFDFHATTIIGPILVQHSQDTDPIGRRFKHTGAWVRYFHGSSFVVLHLYVPL